MIDASALQLTTEKAKALQQLLRDLGLYRGAIDGLIGPKSSAAINAALDGNLAGLSNEDALQMQVRLHNSGHYQGKVDGIAGPQTKAALAAAVKEAIGPVPSTPPPVVVAPPPTGALMDPRSEGIIKDLDPAVQQLFRDEGLAINALIAPYVWKWTSGRRWRAEQQKLWEAYQHGGPKAAPPGSSFHETGFAADGTVFAPDGHTPIYDGPQYDKVVAYIKSNAQMHDHSGHAYGDDPHVMFWPPSLEDGRSETAVLKALLARIENKQPTWP